MVLTYVPSINYTVIAPQERGRHKIRSKLFNAHEIPILGSDKHMNSSDHGHETLEGEKVTAFDDRVQVVMEGDPTCTFSIIHLFLEVLEPFEIISKSDFLSINNFLFIERFVRS